MVDYGYMDVESACPQEGCTGTDTIRVFGQDGHSYYRIQKCSTCGRHYGVKVNLSVSGEIVEYTVYTEEGGY